MRVVMRLLSFLVLVATVIVATIDSTRSIAASSLVLTPLAGLWQNLDRSGFNAAASAFGGGGSGGTWSGAFLWLMSQPAIGIGLILSLLLWAVSYKRSRPRKLYAA